MNARNDVKILFDQRLDARLVLVAAQLWLAARVDLLVARWLKRCAANVEAAQLARAEIEVTDDISIGGFLAKVYKGSHLMQERYEMAPGLWFATYSQYDFEGRRLFMSFGIHERTSYSQYRRIGTPKEALEAIRAELGKTDSANADP